MGGSKGRLAFLAHQRALDAGKKLSFDERGELQVAAGEQEDLCLRFAHASGCAKTSCFWQGWPVCAERVRNRARMPFGEGDEWQLEALCNIAAAEILMP